MHEESVAREPLALLSDPSRRWLLVVGSHLGASSGVPLPFHQTAWSPSIVELVRYQIFQTQSREAAVGIEQTLATGKPPLGMLADTLKAQDAWLRERTSQLLPQGPVLYLAELAKDSMFRGIVSAAYDDLLPNALSMLRVPSTQCSLEAPTTPKAALPFLREYDDTLYQDTAAHRQEEARFLRERLNVMLEEVDGVWFIGHPPYYTDLFEVLKTSLTDREDKQVVWMEERLRLTPSSFGKHPPGNPSEWLESLGPRATIIETDDLAQSLHKITEERNITPGKWVRQAGQGGLTGMLNRTVDMRPILVYIPGVSLFDEALKKLPRVSLKAIFSVVMLVLLLLAGLQFRAYSAFHTQMKKPQLALSKAHVQRSAKKLTLTHLLQSEKRIAEAAQLWQKVKVPKAPLLVLPQLTTYLNNRRKAFRNKLSSYRAKKIIPYLFRARMKERLQENQLMQRLSAFPDIIAARYRIPATQFKQKALRFIERRHPLSFYSKTQHIVLRSPNAMLLRVLQHKHMLRELGKGRLAFAIDLRKRKGLEEQAIAQIKQALERVGPKKQKIELGGIRDWLSKGKASFILMNLDTAGSTARNLSRIHELLLKYPKCRTLLTSYRKSTASMMQEQAVPFLQLAVKPYHHRKAKAFLHDNTSTYFFEGVMSNTYMRWNWNQPLVMAMLVEYYRVIGHPPRGLGALYERLLRRMLPKQSFATIRKFNVLEYLAYYSLRRGRITFTTSEALRWLRTLQPAITEDQFLGLLREVTQQGVLRVHALDTFGFVDKRFRTLFAARHLRRLTFTARKSFLLQQPTLFMAFYVGVQPEVSRLVTGWISEFQVMEANLKKRELSGEWVNPLFPSLVHAALAVHDGRVKAHVAQQLEDILFVQLKEHGEYSTLGAYFTHMLLTAFDFLSTQGVKHKILKGIEADSDLDHTYLRLTARSSSDIYEAAVMRWLDRVCTLRDKRTERHSFTKKQWSLAPAKRKRPSRLHRRHQIAIKNAMTTLIQAGHSSGLRFITRYIQPDTDQRFRRKTWFKLRLHAIKRMLSNGHGRFILPLFSRLAKKEPLKWQRLFRILHDTGEPKAARLLLAIIEEQLDFRAHMRMKEQRAAHKKKRAVYRQKLRALLTIAKEKSTSIRRSLRKAPKLAERKKLLLTLLVLRRNIIAHRKTKPRLPFPASEWRKSRSLIRRMLKMKKSAARSLAHFDKRISAPIFRALLRTKTNGLMDLRVYGAYGLSLMYDKKFFGEIKNLVIEIQGSLPGKRLPRRWRQIQLSLLTQSIEAFGDKRGFRVFKRLYNDKAWRSLDPFIKYSLTRFPIPELHQFALRQLLCADISAHHESMLKGLAVIQTAASRRILNQLLALSQVGDDPTFRKKICSGKLVPYSRIKKRLPLHVLIEAIASFHEPNDLPRLIQWSRSRHFLIALEAFYPLSRSHHPEASRALWRCFLKGKRFQSTTIRALKQPQRKLDQEQLLLALGKRVQQKIVYPKKPTKADYKRLFRMRKKRKKAILALIRLLGVHGEWKAMLRLMPLQEKFSFSRASKSAVLKIAKRRQGFPPWHLNGLLKALPVPKVAKKTPPTSRPIFACSWQIRLWGFRQLWGKAGAVPCHQGLSGSH